MSLRPIGSISALLLPIVAACGGSQAEPQEPAPAPAPVAEPAPAPAPEPVAAPAPAPAPPPGPTQEQIAAAVQARAAELPAPPVDGGTQLATITAADGRRVCRWMTKIQGRRQEHDCPDGSHVTIGSNDRCDATQFSRFQGCSVSLMEMAACFAGMKAQPCESGVFGANLPECVPFNQCVAQQLQAAQRQQGGAPPAPQP